MQQRIILDVDTGIDDAMAIMLAVSHPALRVEAITCVGGNTALANVVANTCKILDVLGAPEIPVAAGAARPLVEPPVDAAHVHGATGLGSTDLPTSERAVDPRHAVEVMRDVVLAAAEPVTLVALAPQTNLALFARTYPEAFARLERVVFMGGSASVGNATAAAEFNVCHDPEAAAIVLGMGVPLTMYGLDVFNRVLIGDDVLEKIRATDDPVAQALAGLVGHTAFPDADGVLRPYGRIGDAGAVLAVAQPDLMTAQRHPVLVELAPGHGRGQTYVDRRESRDVGESTAGWPLVDVVLDIDAEAAAEAFLRTVLGW